MSIRSNDGTIGTRRKLFEKVLTCLSEEVGYAREFLPRDYGFQDYFSKDMPCRTSPAVAFSGKPFSYETACISVLLSNGKQGVDLISDHRMLGTPIAFEVRDDQILYWQVSVRPRKEDLRGIIAPSNLRAVFRENADRWSPKNITRLKNLRLSEARQMDFVDIGLIPALEREIRAKLGPLLNNILVEARKSYLKSTGQPANETELVRLIFLTLTAKVFHDRVVPEFEGFSADSNPETVLERVAQHYRIDNAQMLMDRHTVEQVYSHMWTHVDFRNLSVDVLAYIYENTLVEDEIRRQQGIHATPPSIARYILNQLPLEDIPKDERKILEPCSGHGTFLVAALSRLRNLLPASLTPSQRHKYFVRMLTGFEADPFAIEVGRLCLTLSDFPNPNGWNLHNEDVFASRGFVSSLNEARVVVCNPPFEDFDKTERKSYELSSVHKPAELVSRVLRYSHDRAILGLVLPRVFLDGRGYAELRKKLAARYANLSIVNLPDNAFAHSDHETVVLLATNPQCGKRSVRIDHSKVSERKWSSFRDHFELLPKEVVTKTIDEACDSLAVDEMRELWQELQSFPMLSTICDIHRGIEWTVTLSENRERLIAEVPRRGFTRGIQKLSENMFCFQATRQCEYLNVERRYMKGNKHMLPWKDAKVVVSAHRVSRGRWPMAAFVESEGLVVYQNFHAIWPAQGWSAEVIAAVVNSPIAAAYVGEKEGKYHIRRKSLASIPVPSMTDGEKQGIEVLVFKYTALATKKATQERDATLRLLLRQIDAEVLRAYGLPPRLERKLLDYFNDHGRRLPYAFGDYFPREFKPWIPLWMYDSIDFQESTMSEFKRHLPTIRNPEIIEILSSLE